MSDRQPWNTGNTLTLLTWGTGVGALVGSALWFVGVWYGRGQVDPTEGIKREQTQMAAQIGELRTGQAAITLGLPEVLQRLRQMEADLKRLEGTLQQIEKRGDDRDAAQERRADEMGKEMGSVRERLVVIERSSAGPLPGQPRR